MQSILSKPVKIAAIMRSGQGPAGPKGDKGDPGGGDGDGGGLHYITETFDAADSGRAAVVLETRDPDGLFDNIDLALVLSGNGAFSLSAPDGTVEGGDKRGAFAVDLQRQRDQPDQVAGGSNSVILGGRNNRIGPSGDAAVVTGVGNYANGYASNVSGSGNSVQGGASFVAGSNHVVNASNAFVVGSGSQVSKDYTSVFGVSGCTQVAGQTVNAFCNFDSAGSYQTSETGLHAEMFGAATTTLTANGAAPNADNQLGLRNYSASRVAGEIIASDLFSGMAKSWSVVAVVTRIDSNASVSLAFANVVADGGSPGTEAWDVALSVNTTTGRIQIDATADGSWVRWHCELRAQEASYGL